MTLASFALASLALLPQSQDESGAPSRVVGGQGIVATEGQLQVVYLANGGFMLRTGNFSILIDAFVKDSVEGSEVLPKDVLQMLQDGQKPFDGFVLALVSHNHPDHFHPRVCERFLKSNSQAALMSTPQVVRQLTKGARDFKSIRSQVTAIGVPEGEPRALDRGPLNMGVEMIRLPHAGESEGTVNLAHIVRLGGFTILHVGDSEPDPEQFKKLDLASRGIDVAIVPYWFYMSEEGVRIINDLVQPTYEIVCHVPPSERELFSARFELENPHVFQFASPFESKIFDKRPRDADAGTASPDR